MRFIKYNPDSEMSKYLQTKPIANHLANIIASRARRSKCLYTGLNIGECFLGDYKKIGITEKQYRTAKKVLERIHFASFKGTNKGTVAKLVSIDVWDINTNTEGRTKGEQRANEGTDKGRLTKNDKNIKKDNYIDDFKIVANFYKEITGENIRIGSSDSQIKKSDKYKKIAAGLKEGYTVEDCKKVISYKTNEWLNNPDMKKNICIPTFFRASNFERYLDQAENKTPTQQTDNTTQYKTLREYIENEADAKMLKYWDRNGDMIKFEALYKENAFMLNNVSKAYQNETITPYFLFEVMYMPFGRSMGGSTPDRKLDSFKSFFKRLNDYNQNKGNMRNLVKQHLQTKVL